MTTTIETYTVRPSALDENLWEVEPSDAGLERFDVDLEWLVFWGEPEQAEDGTSYYSAMTWEYFRAEDDWDYIMA